MKQRFTGTRRTASGSATGKSKARRVNSASRYPHLAICVENRGNEASLELGKAYKVLRPIAGDPRSRIRVVDEDGEDYLYLADWFVPVEVAGKGRRRALEVVPG